MNSSARGFTLIEIMIVVGLLLILTGALLPSFTDYIDNQSVVQGVEQVKNDLKSAQNRALTNAQYGSDPIEYWGIHFVDGSGSYEYVVSSDASPTCSSAGTSTVADSRTVLPENTNIVISGTDLCVFFDVDHGGTTATHNIGVARTSGTHCMPVRVSTVGLITVEQSAACPS